MLELAARAAEDGYRVTPRAWDWDRNQWKLQDPYTAKIMLPGGKPPAMGYLMRNPALAATLRKIGREGREAFYSGPVLQDILGRLKELGGLHEEEDFAAQRAEWVEPIHAAYRGYDVYECPPNGQGLAALMILRHGRLLACRRFAERGRPAAPARRGNEERHHVRDDYRRPGASRSRWWLLSDDWADKARQKIRLDRAMPPGVARRHRAYRTRSTSAPSIATATRCLINSLFSSFTGIMAPKSGVLLQNRGTSFRIIAGHPNAIAPRKRPFHTIIPGMLCKDGRAVMPFGVMGGSTGGRTCASAHRMLDRGRPQQAADAPRVFAFRGKLRVEQGVPDSIVADLARRGHDIDVAKVPLGGCQAIWMDHQRDVLIGGSEPRKDGLALGY